MRRKKIVLLFPFISALVLLTGWLQLARLNAAAPATPSATFSVNSTIDTTDVNPGNGICETAPGNGICTLRAAIQESNASTGADTIIMPAGVFTLTIAGRGENAAATGDLDITFDVTIVGAGPEQTIVDANALDRAFHILSGRVNISALTFRNSFLSEPSVSDGGGLRNDGILMLDNTYIISNTIGVSCPGSQYGAGLFNNHVMTITNSLIDGNHSDCEFAAGGGIFNGGAASMLIENSTVQNNSIWWRGGGIFNFGQLQIKDSTIAYNSSYGGGAGLATGNNSSVAIINSILIGNMSEASGATILSGDFAQLQIVNSALIDNRSNNTGQVTLELGGSNTVISNTTISNPTVPGEISTLGSLTVVNTTLIGHRLRDFGSSVITMTNSIIASNFFSNCYFGNVQSLGYNISDDNSCNLTGPGDLQNIDPLLNPLQNYGTTWIHSLQSGSPAIDGGTNQYCPGVDQRGGIRPIDGNGDNNAVCDIGSYEYDPDLPFVTVQDTSSAEGDTGLTAVTFTATLSMTSTETVTVTFLTSNGTAQAGSDYVPASGIITFASGIMTQTMTVSVIGDETHEADETFFISLQDPVNAGIGDGTGVITIINDDPAPPTLNVTNINVSEGNSGTTTANFSVYLSFTSTQPITVSYETLSGSAQAGIDYLPITGQLYFPPGMSSQMVSIQVIGDILYEPDESFYLRLSNPVNATIQIAQGRCMIINDDPPPPQVFISDAAVVEGDSGLRNMVFTVTLSAANLNPVTVTYATLDGTALAGEDYLLTVDTFTFTPGTTVYTVTVPIIGDTVLESDETFTVELVHILYGYPGDLVGEGVIINDDAGSNPSISIFLPLIIKP